MWKPANALDVSRSDRELLETLVRGGKTPQRVVLRAGIVLGASAGRSNNGLAKDLGVTRPTVLLWRERYADRKSTRLNSSHLVISYAVFCLKKEKNTSELQSPCNIVCRLLLDKIIRK